MTTAAPPEREGDRDLQTPAEDDRREHILEAAERLFSQRGVRDVTVRDVAAAAGVTHPLIYYYWSSKDGLLAAVLERSQRRMRGLPADLEPVQAATELARESLASNHAYLVTLARALLDGMPPSRWPGGFPAIERLVEMATERARPEDVTEARARVAAAVAQLFGWALVEDALLEISGLTAPDKERAREVLLDCISASIAPAFATRDTGAGRGLG